MEPLKCRILKRIAGFLLLLFIACNNGVPVSNTVVPAGDSLYHQSRVLSEEQIYDSSLVLLRESLESGLKQPMNLLIDSNFYPLIDHPSYRPFVRDLLKAYAKQNHASLVRQEEPGNRISVEVRVLDEHSNLPVSGVLVELIHADYQGRYFEEQTKWNPRIFGYLITDKNGAVSIETVFPGSYSDAFGVMVSPHIHFSLEKEGYRTYTSEFVLEMDSISHVDKGIVAKQLHQDSNTAYSVTIHMQATD